MATTLRDFLIKLGVDADEKKLKDFDAKLDGVKRTAEGVFRALKFMGGGLAAVAGGTLLATNQTAEYASQVDRLSKALNIGTDEAQAYGYAFNTVGADLFDVADVMNTLSDRAADAQGGMQSFIDDFKLVGLGVKDLKADKPDELFLKFADAIAKTPDKTKGAVAAVRILGDDVGNKLLPLLRRGRRGFQEMAEEANRLGVVMSGDQIEAAKDYQRQMHRLQALLRSFRNTLSLAVIPKLSEAAEGTLTWASANRKWITERIDAAVEKVGDAWEWLYEKLKVVNKFVEERIGGWGNIFRVIAAALAGAGLLGFVTKLITIVKAASAAWGILAGVLAGAGVTSFGAIIAVIAGFLLQLGLVVVAVDDILTYFRGGDSLIGRFLEWASTAEGVTGSIGRFLKGLAELVKEIALTIEDSLGSAFTDLGIIVEPVLDAMVEKLSEIWDWIYEKIKPALDVVGGVFDKLGGKLSNAASNLRRARESGEINRQNRENAEQIAGRLRTQFGAAQSSRSADGTREANRNIANSLSSADTYHIAVGGGGSSDATAKAVRRELEERDKAKRRHAAAVFAGGRR